MTTPIRDITIVGGGTSGWLAAAWLSRALQPMIQAGALKIHLIESAKIGIIGVGEALAPSAPATMELLGISERELFKRCDATFKLSGLFVDWDRHPDGSPARWVNPFYAFADIEGVPSAYFFIEHELQNVEGGLRPDFVDCMSPAPAAIRQKKGPRGFGDPDYGGALRYSYQMNARGFADLLKDKAVERGVNHIVDDVTDVSLDERGWVKSLTLEERGEHPVEFVIDATGFHSVIMHRALGEPIDPFDQFLINDRACVIQTPHKDPKALEPATRATALGSGWAFHVPLFNRAGNGYVYSSQFLSEDEAAEELRNHLGLPEEDYEPRTIKMRVGKIRRSWVNNCLALGLASSFVEPLEATAIHTVERALDWLVEYFPKSDFAPALQNRFNARMDGLFDELVDFIVLHYRTSNRGDTPYWRHVAEDMQIPDSLADNLALWKHVVPQDGDLNTTHFLNGLNYTAALLGKGWYDDAKLFHGQGLSKEAWLQARGVVRQRVDRALQSLPSHYDLVSHLRGDVVQASKAQTKGLETQGNA